jgi:VCBS repeat-containing protein
MLLVKAMNLEEEAKTKMNVQLPFKDAKQIPAGAVGYVAVAVEKGLVSGYTDASFRPNKPVTRAELAALLGRMDDQKPEEEQDGAAIGIKGTVTTSVYSNILTVDAGGKVTAYAIDPAAFVFRGGAKVSVADLKVGDQIIAKAYNNVVIFVEVVTPAADPTQPVVTFSEEGQYQYHSMNASGKIATIAIAQTTDQTTTVKQFNVSDQVTISGNNGVLTMGRTVVLKGQNQIVTSIEIK